MKIKGGMVMSIFGSRDKQKISSLEREIEKKDRRIRQLESLCAEKDEYFQIANDIQQVSG